MTAIAPDTDFYAVVLADAEAIEHALHERLLRDLGYRSDAEVVIAIAEVRAEAEARALTVAALAAGDYADDEHAWPTRWSAALWRSCQIHHAESLWGQLCAPAPADTIGGLL